jgi:hypothetical protein
MEETRRFKNYLKGGRDEISKTQQSYGRIIPDRRYRDASVLFRHGTCPATTCGDKR